MSYLAALANKRMLIVFLMGFASGLPIALIGGTAQAWLKESGVDLALVTFFVLTGLPYTWKFIWAPVLDRIAPPLLEQRRGWILISQLALALTIFCMGLSHPESNLKFMGICALVLAFLGATQDIVIDAYRAEILEAEERAMGASLAILAYRLAMIVSGGLALVMAQHLSWSSVYSCMALLMLACAVVTLRADEPKRVAPKERLLWETAIQSFREFLSRPGSVEILLFVLLYKIGDVMAAAPTTAFMLDIGFSKQDIGLAVKTGGLVSTIVGGLLAGVLMPRLGTLKSLWVFGILQSATIFLFGLLALRGNDFLLMFTSVSIENLCNGMGTAAFTAFLMGLCNRQYTATQYALLTSVMSVTRYLAGSITGSIAKEVGWFWFFTICIAAALPGLLLLTRYRRWQVTG